MDTRVDASSSGSRDDADADADAVSEVHKAGYGWPLILLLLVLVVALLALVVLAAAVGLLSAAVLRVGGEHTSTPLFRAWPATPSINRSLSCAAQLSQPAVLAYWLGLPLDSDSDSDSGSERSGHIDLAALATELDVTAVIGALHGARQQLTAQVRRRQLEGALQTWLSSSVQTLPQLALQRLRGDPTVVSEIDRQLDPTTPTPSPTPSANASANASDAASFWRALSSSPLLDFSWDVTLSDVTTVTLNHLIPTLDERVAFSTLPAVLLAVPRLDSPYVDYVSQVRDRESLNSLFDTPAAAAASPTPTARVELLASYFASGQEPGAWTQPAPRLCLS